MTNEQIIKRFQFDLEMGRFKQSNYFNGIIFHITNHHEFKNLVYVLSESGYVRDVLSIKNIPLIFDLVVVYTKPIKIFDCWMSVDGRLKNINFDKSVNTIPDYIREFDRSVYK